MDEADKENLEIEPKLSLASERGYLRQETGKKYTDLQATQRENNWSATHRSRTRAISSLNTDS